MTDTIAGLSMDGKLNKIFAKLLEIEKRIDELEK